MGKVIIYSSMLCPFCYRAKALLKSKNVRFEEILVDGRPTVRQQMIKISDGRTSVPQVFIGDAHIGGCDDLYALEKASKLDALLGS